MLAAESPWDDPLVSYTFRGVAEGFDFRVDRSGNMLSFVAMNDAVSVLERSTLGLLGAGLLGLFMRRKRVA